MYKYSCNFCLTKKIKFDQTNIEKREIRNEGSENFVSSCNVFVINQ